MRLRSAAHDDSGAVAIWVGATLAVLIGIVGLSLDLGRAATADTELKWAADAAALAGARQLDGNAGAIARATEAAMGAAGVGVTSNKDSFDADDAAVKVIDVKFLSQLGPDNNVALDVETTSDADARYIQVVVEQTVINNLLVQIIGGESTTPVQRSSVAGYGAVTCQVSPLMICNPAEDEGLPFEPTEGDQIWVKMQSSNNNAADWGPGNFGLLDLPSGSQSAKDIGDAFAKKNGTGACYSTEVSTAPGQKTSVSDAINTRLDIYNQSAKDYAKNVEAYPAYNVLKGLIGECGKSPSQGPDTLDKYTGPSDSDQAVAGIVEYPRDNCIYAGNCTAGVRFGDGVWNREVYWATNHPTIAAAARPAGWDTWTRYATYRWEIDNAVPDNPTAGESGTPQCYEKTSSLPGGTIPKGVDARTMGLPGWFDDPDRRVLAVAVVDCDAEGVKGNTKNVVVDKWMLMFLTQAVGYYVGGDDNDLFLEFIREVDWDDDQAIAHEIVQLYR
jgi:Flp pilus assembly protein TadG